MEETNNVNLWHARFYDILLACVDTIQKSLIQGANIIQKKAEIMKSSHVLFFIGVALLVVSFGLDSYIFINMWGEEVGIIGDIQWISQILGIVFVGLGYWKKSEKS